jgi:hypothetical protein
MKDAVEQRVNILFSASRDRHRSRYNRNTGTLTGELTFFISTCDTTDRHTVSFYQLTKSSLRRKHNICQNMIVTSYQNMSM